MRLITVTEYLMGRDKGYPADFTPEIASNAARTVNSINEFLKHGGFDGHVNSGWRPPAVNGATKHAAGHSKHMLALACDLLDAGGLIDRFCIEHPEALEQLGLWHESPGSTPGWCHLQPVPYGSWVAGKTRTFIP